MPRIAYQKKKFGQKSLDIIIQANRILNEYAADGHDMTLRQLYYQFVARDLIANKQSEYKRLGSIINDARMAGMIDWTSLTDRTRNLRRIGHYESPTAFMEDIYKSCARDLWADQDDYVECWIEKDALVGVIQGVCSQERIPYFSCRGYTSQSEMWVAARRLGRVITGGRKVTILHLGDHDPSGIDMTRDITDRLKHFIAGNRQVDLGEDVSTAYATTRDMFEVRRIALTMDQIDQYSPPPNPAKITDSRAAEYISRWGYESWELDALSPSQLEDLILDHVYGIRDDERWKVASAEEEREEGILKRIGQRWDDVVDYLGEG